MTLDRLKGEQTVVWAVAVLADGTIVSGDSMGNVKFWDGTMGTQSQSFKGHKVDVLCLAVGSVSFQRPIALSKSCTVFLSFHGTYDVSF